MAKQEILELAEEEIKTRIISLESRIEYAKIDIKIGPAILESWKEDLDYYQRLLSELTAWQKERASEIASIHSKIISR
jgi:hypothetical protein